jgi:hypothetical protein
VGRPHAAVVCPVVLSVGRATEADLVVRIASRESRREYCRWPSGSVWGPSRPTSRFVPRACRSARRRRRAATAPRRTVSDARVVPDRRLSTPKPDVLFGSSCAVCLAQLASRIVARTYRFNRASARVSRVLAELATATAMTITVVLVVPATNDASVSFCAPISGPHAEVRHLSAGLGCGAAGRVAVRTVESSDGYFKSHSWYCRWGQGGTRPIRVGGYVYYAGFCASKPGYREVTFIGRRL